jgi:tRNA pseudouridine13 synthase
MKLKSQPEDFRVEELTEVVPSDAGDFALYRLTKRGIGTPEAIDALLRRWNIPRRRVSYGGLKDRHAVTAQHLTIHRGPRRDLQQTNVELKYLGRTSRAFEPGDIASNRFTIVLRSLTPAAADAAAAEAEEVKRDLVPNYFDDQRFGSVGPSGEFIGHAWIRGDYERTLWLALAEEHPFDRSGEKTQKRLLREHWGRWIELKALLQRSHRRSIVTYLCDRPHDFRGAWARVNVDLRRLYLSAFQSEMWNRILAAALRRTCRPELLFDVRLKTMKAPFFRGLDVETRSRLHDLQLPLPAARLKLEPGPIRELVDATLAEAGLTLRELRVKYPRDSFFSKGWRAAVVSPRELHVAAGDDELEHGKRKLALQFILPRGAYATIVVKRLTLGTDLAT